jgi:hypothetical protein
MSYTIAQYKAMADMIELAIEETPANHQTILKVFANCKTKTDVLLIIGYFGVRTYQATSMNDIKILNIFQFLHIPLMSNVIIEGINNTLKKRNIDYKFY